MICVLSDFRLEIAKDLGFKACNSSKADFSKKARDYFGTANSLKGQVADIDGFIDASGADEGYHLFAKKGKIESRFISVSVNQSIRQLDLLQLTYSQKSIIGSGGYTPEDVFDVMNIMKCGKWDIEKIITHEFPLSEIETAIQTAANTDISLNVTIKFE